MLKTSCIQIKSIATKVDDESFELRINVFNTEKRTVYAYASPRRIVYDSASKGLLICLHDKHIKENTLASQDLKEPKIAELEGNANTEIRIRFPKTMNRLKSAEETGGKLGVEVMNIYQAETIKLEIAHQDTPFYYNPKIDNARQLKEWGKVVAEGKFDTELKKNKRKEEPGSNDKLK